MDDSKVLFGLEIKIAIGQEMNLFFYENVTTAILNSDFFQKTSSTTCMFSKSSLEILLFYVI